MGRRCVNGIWCVDSLELYVEKRRRRREEHDFKGERQRETEIETNGRRGG